MNNATATQALIRGIKKKKGSNAFVWGLGAHFPAIGLLGEDTEMGHEKKETQHKQTEESSEQDGKPI